MCMFIFHICILCLDKKLTPVQVAYQTGAKLNMGVCSSLTIEF